MLSNERSGPSPITHVGKSSIGILKPFKIKLLLINYNISLITYVFLDDT